MTRKTYARVAWLLIAALTALLASCDNLITRTPPADVGGGYAAEANSAGSGALTVTASVSGGTSRHAMPSLEVSDFAYAALLYSDDSRPTNPTDEDFVAGTLAEEASTENRKLTFSFTRPEDPNGDFTLEIFAFDKRTDEKDFSRTTAILSGSAPVKVGTADTISISKPVPLEVNSSYTGTTGTVSLKVQVPAGCTLEISGDYAEKFKCEEEDESTPNTYTISQNGDGIPAGAYQLTLTVEKDGSLLYVLSEYINVLPGMCTDTWDGCGKGGAREIDEKSFSTTVYVRGTGGWYEDSPYKDTARADDGNFGSFLAPLETIQKAVDKVLAMNDGKSDYTIYVDGTLKQDEDSTASSMTSFSALDKNLKLTIKALSPDNGATLDAGGVSRVIYAIPTSGTLTLTLENLVITGGSTTGTGGGVYFNRGTLTMRGGAVRDNNAGNYAGGVYVGSNGAFTMEDGVVISGNRASTNGFGGGVYVTGGTLNINDGEISGNTATSSGGGVYVTGGTLNMKGGKISANEAPYYAGVFVKNSTFTMKAGSISDNTANHTGGVYVESGTFDMSGGTISGNKSTSNSNGYGGGVVVGSSATFNMTSGTISNNIAEIASGGGVYVVGTFNMSGDAVINENKAYSSGGGVSVETGGEFTMTGGEIGNNTSSGLCGGGVYVYGGSTFTMTAGSISGNKAYTYGGGVYVSSACEFTMSGGAITENNAKYGGGVSVGGTFNMTGGTIGGSTASECNTASSDGGGVYVSSGKFNMSGGAKVADENDVYLVSTTSSSSTTYATITVAGKLTESSVATITPSPSSYMDGTQVLSAGDGVSAEQMEAACGKFDIKPESDGTEWKVRYDSASNSGVLSTNTFYVRGSNAPWYASNNPSAQASDSNAGSRSLPFETIQKAVDTVIAENDGTSKYTIYVDGTFTATSTAALADFNNSSKSLSVKIAGLDSSNKAVLDGNDTAIGIAVGSDSVQNNVNLALENLVIQKAKGSPNEKGKIRGGGVILCAYEGNSHTIKNCEMKNNNADYGSAIYNKYGLLDLQNCVIRDNTTGTSGAVYIGQKSAILTMSDVTIENNTANNGGGIFIYANATVKISDSSVVIRGNSANSDTPARGAGISVWLGYLELSGNAKIEDNVGLYGTDSPYTHEIHVTDALTGTSPVATLVLNSYSSGEDVLYARGGVEITQAICEKFALYNSSYKIVPSDDGSTGILASQ